MLLKLFKLNAWMAFACGVFALMMATQIVDGAAMAMGQRPERINRDELYFVAVTFVRVCGILILAYSALVRIMLKSYNLIDNLRVTMTIFALGLLVWGGMLVFLIPTKFPILLSVLAVALLQWLMVPLWLLFNYKKSNDWTSVKPPQV